jgi:hypothetical protein
MWHCQPWFAAALPILFARHARIHLFLRGQKSTDAAWRRAYPGSERTGSMIGITAVGQYIKVSQCQEVLPRSAGHPGGLVMQGGRILAVGFERGCGGFSFVCERNQSPPVTVLCLLILAVAVPLHARRQHRQHLHEAGIGTPARSERIHISQQAAFRSFTPEHQCLDA